MQQLFRLLIFFKSAQHFSSDKFAHPQERFLRVCTAFSTTHRLCCRSEPRLWWNSIPTVAPVGSRGGAFYQKLYIHLKIAPEDGRVCRPKHAGLIWKRLIKEKLLHFVGCLRCWTNDARSHKHLTRTCFGTRVPSSGSLSVQSSAIPTC